MRKTLAIFFVISLAVLLPSAWAATTNLNPGDSTIPNPVPFDAFNGTQVASILGATLTNGGGINATYNELVYMTVTGQYDFYFQVNNSPTADNINEVTLLDYSGWTTAVGKVVPPSFAIGPSSANRTAGSGDGVNFFFVNGSGQNTLGSQSPGGMGDKSYWLEIATNAPAYALTGSINVQDGGNASNKAFAPTPEPATTGIVGGALALMALVSRRRLAKKA